MSSSSWLSTAARVLVTASLLAAVVLAGQIPFGRSIGEATLRLSLRTVNTRLEVCRDRSPEELEALPFHMRQPTVCEGISPTYQVRATLDGYEVITVQADPGGVRGDRPLIVDQEVTIDPGVKRLEVSMTPIEPPGMAQTAQSAFARIPRYFLDREVTLAKDRITLVLLDQEDGELKVYQPAD